MPCCPGNSRAGRSRPRRPSSRRRPAPAIASTTPRRRGRPLSVKVQELFGLAVHPAVAGVPIVLETALAGGRPVQITRDLPGFWRGSWRDVRTEMRGRYPKHVWPDDPAAALPTLRAKPRR